MYANKLANLVTEELQTTLQESLVTKDSFGKYYLYGKYSISLVNQYYSVTCSEKILSSY